MAKPDDEIPPHILKLLRALSDFEQEVKEQASQEAFQAGWEAAVKHVQAKMQSAATQMPPSDARPVEPARTVSAEAIRSALAIGVPTIRQRGSSTKGLVYEAIIFRPGLRGVELLDRARITDPELHERTLRTALHRLKKEGKIEIVEGRWYVKGSAPASSQPELIDDPNVPS